MPPTRRSRTVYADEAPANIEDGAWALSAARCALSNTDLVADGLRGTLEIEKIPGGYAFRLTQEGAGFAEQVRVELVRASCPRCVELYLATLSEPAAGCNGSCAYQGVAHVTRDGRRLVWSQSLPNLCHGEPVTLRFSPRGRHD
jgi:hypothetical protein